jgi:hypothetical protein
MGALVVLKNLYQVNGKREICVERYVDEKVRIDVVAFRQRQAGTP